MQDFAFVDETLDINLTQSYYLSIQLNLDGLSFCILDPVREKYIAFESKSFPKDQIFDDYLDELEKYIQNTKLLNHKFKAVKLMWLSGKNTLIPNSYFNKDKLKSFFEFNQKLDDLDEIHYNELKYVDAYSIFVLPNQVANIFSKQFHNITYYNQQITFIDRSLYKHHTESKKVIVNINTDFIDICIIEDGKLLLYNNFVYKTETDILYFILYVFDQFNLDTQHIELFLNGRIEKASSLYNQLHKFIKHLKFDKLPSEFSYSYTFNKVPAHTFTNLFNLHLCE
jgi:hypothetical protein